MKYLEMNSVLRNIFDSATVMPSNYNGKHLNLRQSSWLKCKHQREGYLCSTPATTQIASCESLQTYESYPEAAKLL